jgi:hypothetical protein
MQQFVYAMLSRFCLGSANLIIGFSPLSLIAGIVFNVPTVGIAGNMKWLCNQSRNTNNTKHIVR